MKPGRRTRHCGDTYIKFSIARATQRTFAARSRSAQARDFSATPSLSGSAVLTALAAQFSTGSSSSPLATACGGARGAGGAPGRGSSL